MGNGRFSRPVPLGTPDVRLKGQTYLGGNGPLVEGCGSQAPASAATGARLRLDLGFPACGACCRELPPPQQTIRSSAVRGLRYSPLLGVRRIRGAFSCKGPTIQALSVLPGGRGCFGPCPPKSLKIRNNTLVHLVTGHINDGVGSAGEHSAGSGKEGCVAWAGSQAQRRLGVREGPIRLQEVGAENGLLCAQTQSGRAGSSSCFHQDASVGGLGTAWRPCLKGPPLLMCLRGTQARG